MSSVFACFNPAPTGELTNFREYSFGNVAMNILQVFENYFIFMLHLFSVRKDLEMAYN